jgi:hypothetical protein
MSKQFPTINSASFYSDAREVVERPVNTTIPSSRQQRNLEEYYEIEKTAEYILKNNYKRVFTSSFCFFCFRFATYVLADWITVSRLSFE